MSSGRKCVRRWGGQSKGEWVNALTTFSRPVMRCFTIATRCADCVGKGAGQGAVWGGGEKRDEWGTTLTTVPSQAKRCSMIVVTCEYCVGSVGKRRELRQGASGARR